MNDKSCLKGVDVLKLFIMFINFQNLSVSQEVAYRVKQLFSFRGSPTELNNYFRFQIIIIFEIDGSFLQTDLFRAAESILGVLSFSFFPSLFDLHMELIFNFHTIYV